MGPLAAVERFLERLFERQTARLFRTAIRPIQVQRRIERQMEGNRTRDGARTIVPHAFIVRLRSEELTALVDETPQLAATLADAALAFARAHGYTLLDRPTVTLRPDPRVDTGDIAVAAVDPYRPPLPDLPSEQPGGAAEFVAEGAADLGGAPARVPQPGVGQASVARPNASSTPVADRTAVFLVPEADGPRATIREIRPDRSSRTIEFDGRPITIGRAPENGLVLRDGRASRHHARIDGRRGSLVLSDLGSTNGSYVNDRQVQSVALGEGDRIQIGTTSLIVEAIRRGPGPLRFDPADEPGLPPGVESSHPPSPPDRGAGEGDIGGDRG